MIRVARVVAAAGLCLSAAVPLQAQQAVPADAGSRIHAPLPPEQLGHGRTMKVNPTAHEAPSTVALAAASEHMHHAMAIDYTGDADTDFVRTMIPHHEGAVEMARIVLQHGKDPQIRKLAEAVIAAQQAEIALMQEWLKRK